jgi:outer membrane protein assembly factor BamE (lipoprotein component of BamABCDE complex)
MARGAVGTAGSWRKAGALGAGRVALLAALIAAAACTPIVDKHGWAPSDDQLAEIAVGRDTRATVQDVLGTPSAGGLVDGSGYYYVSQRMRSYGFREPEVVDREIVAISFDGDGVVRNIERFGLEDGNVVALSRRVTDSNVQGISFLRQLLGNLGRIAPEDLAGGS